jgi:hypothetical protein
MKEFAEAALAHRKNAAADKNALFIWDSVANMSRKLG